eukprot:TRINITY_DN2865_c0_g1_i1.p1 TRINITY_DN2865_c0_g1~~TRINITY_DN2865_c0_g1_i1.p1  ORF type:complete len:207 (-),score=28.89 TRINITY_DN2865_c0_g1_i1:304-924(-)
MNTDLAELNALLVDLKALRTNAGMISNDLAKSGQKLTEIAGKMIGVAELSKTEREGLSLGSKIVPITSDRFANSAAASGFFSSFWKISIEPSNADVMAGDVELMNHLLQTLTATPSLAAVGIFCNVAGTTAGKSFIVQLTQWNVIEALLLLSGASNDDSMRHAALQSLYNLCAEPILARKALEYNARALIGPYLMDGSEQVRRTSC